MLAHFKSSVNIMSEFSKLISGHTPVLVDFYAEWCGPCKAMAPVLTEVSRQLQGKAKVIKVDVDKNPAAAAQYGIRSVPTLLLFQDGEIRWKQSGALQAQELLGILSRYV